MKKTILIIIISSMFLFSSCAKTDNTNSEYDILKKENDELKTTNQRLSAKVTELEESLDLASKDIMQVKKQPINDYLQIDGTAIPIPEGSYLLSSEGREYISFDLIKEIYGMEGIGGNLIKGLPLEKDYVIKTDGILYIDDYISRLEKQFQGQNDYNDISIEEEGLKIVYGEVGLRKYIITKPLYMTQRGITVGSTRTDVRKAYGQLGSDDAQEWSTFTNSAEYSEGNSYRFLFAGDRVSEIHYGWD